MLYVTTESTKFSPALQIFSFGYLRRAFIIISDTESDYNCDIMIRTLLETPELRKLLDRE